MNHTFPVPLRRALVALALGIYSLWAAAHGDEPHGDEPHPAPVAASATPAFVAASDMFELVARLHPAGLTIFINRYETSEPVLQASVEVESGSLKAQASFQDQQGSYIVRDEAFVEALSRPGTHPLVVTLLAGDDADLLEGTMTVAAPADLVASPAPAPGTSPAFLALLAVVAGGAFAPGAWYLRGRLAAKGKGGGQ